MEQVLLLAKPSSKNDIQEEKTEKHHMHVPKTNTPNVVQTIQEMLKKYLLNFMRT